jgi:hypothetical protein
MDVKTPISLPSSPHYRKRPKHYGRISQKGCAVLWFSTAMEQKMAKTVYSEVRIVELQCILLPFKGGTWVIDRIITELFTVTVLEHTNNFHQQCPHKIEKFENHRQSSAARPFSKHSASNMNDLPSLRPRVSTCRLQNGQGQAGILSGLARVTKALLWRAMGIPLST